MSSSEIDGVIVSRLLWSSNELHYILTVVFIL